MNESIIIPRDGKLVALVTFNENAIDWNQEGEDEFFRKIEEYKSMILNIVNKNVNRTSKVSAVQILREPFEKTATRKIRRFKYFDVKGIQGFCHFIDKLAEMNIWGGGGEIGT